MIVPEHVRPEDDDLIIREDSRDGERVYVLRTARGADQYIVHSRDDAITQATWFASRHRLRVWTATKGDYTLVRDFRRARVAGPS